MEGTLPEDDLRRAFVAGAKWWELHQTGATMWQSDRNLAEDEAERRYPNGKPAAAHLPQTGEKQVIVRTPSPVCLVSAKLRPKRLTNTTAYTTIGRSV